MSAWSAEQASRRKRHLLRSAEGGRRLSDDREIKKQRQELLRNAKSCCSDDLQSREEKEAKVKNGEVNSSYELDRHCRLTFGPALGTRSMTRWRAANGFVNHAEIHSIRYRSCDRTSSGASVSAKQPQEHKHKSQRDRADSKKLTAIGMPLKRGLGWGGVLGGTVLNPSAKP